VRLQNSLALFGNFLAASEDLRDFAGAGPLNTDDRPVVIFEAPRFVYSHQEPPYVRLLALMEHLRPRPRDILQPAKGASEASQDERLAAYWEARHRFLRAGAGVEGTSDPKKLLQAVQKPLLAIVRQCQDFTPAYDTLLFLARRLYREEPLAGRELLLNLERANPQRQEAGKMQEALLEKYGKGSEATTQAR
jgi:spermidine synthase